MGVGALIGMAVGILGVGLIYTTFRETRRGAEEGARSNQIAADTAQRQLRAYLVAKSFKISGVLPGHIPRVYFELKNVGQTPAYEVRLWWEIRTFPGAPPASGTRVGRSLPPEGISRAIIGAGEPAEISVGFEGPVSGPWIAAVRTKQSTVLAFGIVSYRDAFKRRRLLAFKMFLSPEHLEANGWGTMLACEKGCAAN